MGAAQREASEARGALIDRHSADGNARQGRAAIVMDRIDAKSKAFDRMVTSAAGFTSEYHEKTEAASGDIDAL